MKFFINEKCYDIMPNYPRDEIIDYDVLNELCYMYEKWPIISISDLVSFKDRLKKVLKIHQDIILKDILLKNQYNDILSFYLHYGLEILEEKNIYNIINFVLSEENTDMQELYLDILKLDCFLSPEILFSIDQKIKETSRSRIAFLLRKDLPESDRYYFYNTYTIANLEEDIEMIKTMIDKNQENEYGNYIFNNDKITLKYISLLLCLQDLLIEKTEFALESLEKDINVASDGISKIKSRFNQLKDTRYGEIYGIIYG